MMSYDVFGDQGLRILPGATFSVTREGLLSGTQVFEAPKTKINLFPRRGSRHPFFRKLIMSDYTITLNEALARMEGRYYGVDNANERGETERVYSLVMGTGQEPIETHPDFRSIAGTPARPLRGARFIDPETGKVILGPNADNDEDDATGAGGKVMVEKKGAHFEAVIGQSLDVTPTERDVRIVTAVFDGFVGGSLSGVTSYLDVNNVIWRESWTSDRIPTDVSLGMVGRIMDPPGPVPNFGRRNWLYVGLNFDMKTVWRDRGDAGVSQSEVYSCSREWKLSGRRGWSTVIYD